MASIRLPDGRTVTVESTPIETTSIANRSDPDWRHTDTRGHEHHAESNGFVSYPTLRWVVDEEDYVLNEGTDDDPVMEEYPGSGHHECLDCGEHVTPGTLGPSPWAEYVPGPRHYYLDDKPISAEEAERLIAEARS